MRKTFIRSLLALTAAVALASCSGSKAKIEYLPFQETENGQWGMISPDGEVLFKEEFKNMPTTVNNGRFFVKNSAGLWEMYEATEKPKKVGKEYASAAGFVDGVALVAEKGKPVSIIDKDGNVKKVLDKIDGKTVDGVQQFSDGYAVFLTTDTLVGAIDKSGKCVIKPEYYYLTQCADGKFIGIKSKYKKFIGDEKNKGKIKFTVIDTDGKVLFELNGDKYTNGGSFADGLMPVSVKKDGKEIWGIINDKGETVVKPSEKLKGIGQVDGDRFTYYNGDGWGLMNLKGETLIRAKYESLLIDDDGILLATVKDGDNTVYRFIDDKDNKLSEDTYTDAWPYSISGGKHALVKADDKMWTIIDKEGKAVKDQPDIVNISLSDGDGYVRSDYVDINAMLASYKITYNGVLGITTASTTRQVAELAARLGVVSGNKQYPATSAYWYDYTSSVTLYHTAEGTTGKVDVNFNGYMSRQTYRNNRVIDYTFGDYYWYHDEKIPTGYAWNDINPNTFRLSISNDDRMKGKLRSLYTALSGLFKNMGRVAKENDGAMVVELKNGLRAMIYMQSTNVTALWGNLPPASELDITPYKDVAEAETSGDEASAATTDTSSNDYSEADTAIVDTTVAAY